MYATITNIALCHMFNNLYAIMAVNEDCLILCGGFFTGFRSNRRKFIPSGLKVYFDFIDVTKFIYWSNLKWEKL